MRLFELEAICENCLAKKSPKIALKKQQRESEEEDAEAAIAEHEKDRSGLDEGARRRRRKFGRTERRIDHGGSLLAPGRATADLADVRGSR